MRQGFYFFNQNSYNHNQYCFILFVSTVYITENMYEYNHNNSKQNKLTRKKTKQKKNNSELRPHSQTCFSGISRALIFGEEVSLYKRYIV